MRPLASFLMEIVTITTTSNTSPFLALRSRWVLTYTLSPSRMSLAARLFEIGTLRLAIVHPFRRLAAFRLALVHPPIIPDQPCKTVERENQAATGSAGATPSLAADSIEFIGKGDTSNSPFPKTNTGDEDWLILSLYVNHGNYMQGK
jgi:hypothetical protein